MSYRIPIIFDTDIGVDDAFALLLAAGNTSIDLLGITTVFGNSSVENCTENALRICELLDLKVPVAKGASKSLFGEVKDYSLHKNNFVHGADGLGGKRYMRYRTCTLRSSAECLLKDREGRLEAAV